LGGVPFPFQLASGKDGRRNRCSIDAAMRRTSLLHPELGQVRRADMIESWLHSTKHILARSSSRKYFWADVAYLWICGLLHNFVR
jgi:hypothetical protein